MRNRRGCSERQSFCPTWESDPGLRAQSPVRYPQGYRFTQYRGLRLQSLLRYPQRYHFTEADQTQHDYKSTLNVSACADLHWDTISVYRRNYSLSWPMKYIECYMYAEFFWQGQTKNITGANFYRHHHHHKCPINHLKIKRLTQFWWLCRSYTLIHRFIFIQECFFLAWMQLLTTQRPTATYATYMPMILQPNNFSRTSF